MLKKQTFISSLSLFLVLFFAYAEKAISYHLEGAVPISANGTVLMHINGKIEISTKNADRGEYLWHISGTSEGKTEDLTFGFNAQFLIDAVRSYTSKENDSVTMEVSGPLSPCLINGHAVVMPMRT
jgi:DNA polymerase III sliding clamp (beta) subunit (PCNA family)